RVDRPDQLYPADHDLVAAALTAAIASTVQRPQLALRGFELFASRLRQVLARAVDVERQHRHRGAIRIALATLALLSGLLERLSDAARTVLREDAGLQVERVALLGHFARPPSRLIHRSSTSEDRGVLSLRYIHPSVRFLVRSSGAYRMCGR